MLHNTLLLADSYKYSHYNQYPADTKRVFSYFESRGGMYKDIVFYGLEYYLTVLEDIAHDLLNDADGCIYDLELYSKKHGIPFNETLWKDLAVYVDAHKKLPIEIHAVEEKQVYPSNVALFTVENISDRFYWLTSWLETLLMKVWYPTTVASKAYAVKQLLKTYYNSTSDNPDGVNWAYHNFGDRGSSSIESAYIGGLAHLTQFNGTDNFNAACWQITCANVAGSIPASEHSTVTSWGKENEFRFYKHYLETYKSYPMIACVLDSYNIYDAVSYVTGPLKEKIESADYPIFVIRPDSGDAVTVLTRIIQIMESNQVQYKINSKGFKVWNKYRIIWGDGITVHTIHDIANLFLNTGYAIDNIAFGSGGDLMQNLTRDTCKFAMKCSAIQIGDKWQDVFKDPVTDPGKVSKKGRLITIKWKSDGWHDKKLSQIQTIRQDDFDAVLHEPLMQKVY